MHIAVVGCGHGEVDKIYEVLAKIEEQRGFKASLLLICGDFETMRNATDLECLACPPKYRHMHDFHQYYSGEKKAPVLTLFIGGNHEASNYLQELPYGGWVAPNMFYLGQVSLFRYGPLRIGGISGIYKSHDYLKGRYEAPPYNQNSMRSVYHYRNIDIFRLKQINDPVDIFLSHDWPEKINEYGNERQLLKKKPFFRREIDSNELGSRPLSEVLMKLQPKFWFSAHMHVKFAAYVPHRESSHSTEEFEDGSNANNSHINHKEKVTHFLALDKVLPGKQFLQIIEIPVSGDEADFKLEYDPEWLSILKFTNHLVSLKDKNNFMPGPGGNSRYDFSPTPDELNEVLEIFKNDFRVPENFRQTAPVYSPDDIPNRQPFPIINPQTREFCQKLEIIDPVQEIVNKLVHNPLLLEEKSVEVEDSVNPDEISLDMEEEYGESSSGSFMKSETTSKNHSSSLPHRSKLNLPPPMSSELPNETDESLGGVGNETELQLLRSVMGNIEEESSSSNSFYIDTHGEGPPSKRRNRDFKY